MSCTKTFSQTCSCSPIDIFNTFPSSLNVTSTTADNPYLEATDAFITTRLVDTLSLPLVNRYADPELMMNLPPPVENVMVTTFGDSGLRELTILAASESPNNPYETYVSLYTVVYHDILQCGFWMDHLIKHYPLIFFLYSGSFLCTTYVYTFILI